MVNEELKARERLALATLKANKEIQLKKIRTSSISNKARISKLKSFEIGQQLNSEQSFMQELFGGGQHVLFNSPDSQSLPKLNGSLMPNRFNEFEDMEENSADVFGLRKDGRTGGLFGI